MAGPDGNMWFAVSYTDQVGRITMAGQQRIWDVDSTCYPQGIGAGADRALWFTCGTLNVLGRITTAGAVTYYPVPNHGDDFLEGITRVPDGAMWFTEASASRIGRIATR